MRRDADFKLQRGTLGEEQGFFAILRQGTGKTWSFEKGSAPSLRL